MTNNHEVELRVLLSKNESKSILDKIEKSGAIFKSQEKITDIYFCAQEVKDFSEVEMNEVGSYSLRLRKSEQGKHVKTDLNMKIITSCGDHHAWEEHEVILDSSGEMQTMLKAMHQKPFIKIEKKRTIFSLNKMSIIVEDIKDFGVGLEIEIITSKENTEKAKSKIKKFLSSIGIGEEKIVPKSITNIIMREKAKF